MAEIRPDQPLMPSVLDRLIDDAPDEQREAPQSRSQVLRELRNSVRRDLENLLNTRRRHGTLPADARELDRSLVTYGVPDLKAFNVTSEEGRRQLVDVLQRVVRQFEPRFKSVRVQLLDNVEPLDRMLRFRVDALLHAEPAPEPVIFDSMLEPVSAGFRVTTSAR